MSPVGARVLCLAVGYALGNIMTAEVVTRRLTGKPCSELGTTGNPGMANVMANLGFRPGILVLAGDLGKCGLACLLSFLLAGPAIGHISVLYGGIGATLGHDYPIWLRPGRGGKGVATSCFAIFLFSPLWGLVSNVIGMLVTFATKYLCIGGAVLPASFVPFAFAFYGKEAGILSALLALLCFTKHWPAIRTIPAGTCERTDVWGAIRSHLRTGRKEEK
ncbi:MAG: glycerol-3-phosphate acyltransferase [Lachnospiraceae bacterium]|nr:glycerol-3-phosphate acyltransferase [Lachnospiraceae bacterium]